MADLPLILAGPILRRVEPTLVAVWVALSQPRALTLTVFEGFTQTGPGRDRFLGGQLRMRGGANTLRLGDHLHVGVVFAENPAIQPLNPATNYSYNVGFGPFRTGVPPGGTFDVLQDLSEADLKTEGLLSDQPLNGRPHLPIGYTVGELPSFALPPVLLTDLRILHGSCRRPGHIYDSGDGKNSFDGMAWVDDLILEWRRGAAATQALDPNVRPHQLFLTGDQIYADDVALPMVPFLNRAAKVLIGKTELLPTRYPPEADLASREKFLGVPKQAGFSDLDDFVRKKRAARLDPLDELKNDPRVRALQDPSFDRLFKLLFLDPFQQEGGFQSDGAAPGIRFWPADLDHFTAVMRRPLMEAESKFSSADLSSHLMSLGEYCAMYLAVFANTIWEMDGQKPRLATVEELYSLPATLSQLWDLHACFTWEDACLARKDRPALEKSLADRRLDKGVIQGVKDATDTLEVFFGSLARVRRGLANIPTYMVFDDHDVTDDWNLTRAWRDRVHTSPLGRGILNSALVAYALFQDWGNDPKRYTGGDYRKVLDQAVKFFPENAPAGPAPAVTNELAKLFALNQPDPEPAPALKWHFSIDGPAHRVIALDTRTRRVFRARYAPPGLLSPAALKEQLPDPAEKPLPAGIEVLIVISQTPVLQPSLASSVIVPLMTAINEVKHHEELSNMQGVEPDNEIWPGDDQAFESCLEQLAKFKQVVVLSGEVHFGFSAQLSFWKKGIKRLTLADSLVADLDAKNLSAAIRAAFQGAGITLSAGALVLLREGNPEWSILDEDNHKVYNVRQETGGVNIAGLNVYEEQGPARVAQFVSSGLKNVKALIATLGKGMGVAFSLIDLTPVERLIWAEKFPTPLVLPSGVKPPLVVRGRLAAEPVMVPAGNWPPGTLARTQPDFAWRIDLVRDERPDAERPDFVRPSGTAPEFDVNDIPGSYHKIIARHAAQVGKLRFTRGVVYQSNLGLVRFERNDEGLVACHDLYSHPPNKHQAVLLNVYRVPLKLFADQRPQLHFDLATES